MGSRIRNENFYTVFGWMLNELELKGNELIIFGIIYSFSQDGKSEFNGSLTYLQTFANIKSKNTVLSMLNGGDPISFNGGRVSDSGVYTLTVVDMYENSVTYSWTILPDIAQSYNFTIPSGSAVSVLKDGYVISGCVNGNKVELKENGEYELTFSNNGNGNAYTLTVTVDSVKPTVEITQEKNKVIISQPSKDNVTYELMLNGKSINFTMGKAITATGNYVLTVTDAYGNSSVYSFELDYINAWGIAVIVIAVIVVTTLFLTIFISRKRQGVK